jgi:dihydroneopterin aldolase
VKKEDDLIYDLIFSEKETYKIDISDYIVDIYTYEEFIEKVKKILKKSKVKIISSSTLMSSKTVIWELKVKK